MGWGNYSSAIDMWAVGCIVAELCSRTPLFPGENAIKQLSLIIGTMGLPDDAFISRSKKPLFRFGQFAEIFLFHQVAAL